MTGPEGLKPPHISSLTALAAAVRRDEGVTGPKGFVAAGVAAGIKKSGARDLAVIVNTGPGREAAGVFTTNKVKAAPVLWSQQVLTTGKLRAVVLNSGGANACTGPQGFADTHHTAEEVAAALTESGTETGAVDVAVCSTGLIGDLLPMPAVLAGVRTAVQQLSSSTEAGTDAASAIMTTDTVSKEAVVHHQGGWAVGGTAKGAGMLAPALATMLCVVTTDAVATSEQLDTALRHAAKYSFERLDVDGATSTNDTVLLLASGASGVAPSQAELTEAVSAVCDDLADQLMADAEGVTKRVHITVAGASSESEALTGARAVARDSLVKTALFGSDPNWGRVLAAIGIAPIALDPDRISVFFNGEPVCKNGVGVPGARDVDLSGMDITVRVELGIGAAEATIRTTDLSHAYVEENSAYSS
ncbi:bifunctional glutamate N-acetyltransferase/amino-acid acetyltransferase ArgJ [Hoyosella subflava]|uniref:Arginine biosynthesis bifunctional protein ArgJ n=1 Tax=Hoyosella subflava (strain DSM 45089 / JCM 17490 / NBRC 109087 / DQS3-9A1) TaxID=443218 RepID=F6EI10_HOYSD|nr:bifunctional glutamate N-acetyltransferase/amino-acid acetyltransferase ArgJ [Hoyosella subflava]AEF39959.1 Arginine biosynthesis bifunctional protein ArgJ [Hoyosella subflava DQS3-9A1]